jgi:hypothetical protein
MFWATKIFFKKHPKISEKKQNSTYTPKYTKISYVASWLSETNV